MCDYSLHSVASRPARAGDKLITTNFPGTATRGFAAIADPNVAVCLLPGTEIAFDQEPLRGHPLASLLSRLGIGRIGARLARFRRRNANFEIAYHDALEFANGKEVFLTSLRPGQRATVLQLPASAPVVDVTTAPEQLSAMH